MLNCKKTIERLYPYLDRELSEQELVEVREHLDLCPPCAKHFAFESGVLRVVSDACKAIQAPAALRARIMSSRTNATEVPPTK